MARVFTDSCGDHYDAAHILSKWSGAWDASTGLPTIVPNGRTGNCFQYRWFSYGQFWIWRTFPNAGTLTAGMAYKMDAMPINARVGIFQFGDSGTVQMTLMFDQVGRLIVAANNADAGVSPPGIVTANTWMYIETQIAFATDNTGSIVVRVNEHEVINVTHTVRTTSTANASANQFLILCGNNECGNAYFDDIYVNDGTVTAGDPNNSDFLGDQQVLARFPDAPGQITQWSIGGTSPAATNWQSVGETVPDDDTTYVTTDTVGAIDLYKIGSLPGNVQQVTGVQVMVMARSDGGSVSAEPMLGNGTTHLTGDTAYLNASYSTVFQTYGQNPLTGAAWQPGDFDTLEIGVKRTS